MKRRTIVLLLLLAFPALAWNGENAVDLRERLGRTLDSITDFKLLERRVAARDASAIAELIAATEPGPADSIQAEVDLVQLRERVAALQEILDARALESGEEPIASRAVELAPVTETPIVRAPETQAISESPVSVDPRKVAFEADGFIADRSRLGRACWRGGRYQEGVATLEPLAGEPQADYWRARCLEKLARNTEARALYRHVIQVAGESPEGRSAREDLEFLEWSLLHGVVQP